MSINRTLFVTPSVATRTLLAVAAAATPICVAESTFLANQP
jgi:hypothetical protein